MPPQVLEEFRRFVPTTWNLGKQCVETARVFDDIRDLGDAGGKKAVSSPDSI